MSIFNKLKQGVSEAGTKAINTVEANRLKSQIGKNNDLIQSLFTEIGRKVFSEYHNPQIQIGNLVDVEVNQIHELLSLNGQLEIDIKAIWNQKQCTCGNLVALDAKFCSACGTRFNTIQINEQEASLILEQPGENMETVSLGLTGTLNDKPSPQESNDSIFCPNCDAEIEADSKFCGECGHMMK
ncbi:zinc-ribbon domain-containing protein [Neobacillus sp. Marseille-QA0830]